MKRLRQGFLLAAAMIAAAPAPADDFYLTRLRSGEEAHRSKQYAMAADELRIACFGLLEQPPLLMEGLIHLGLVQAALPSPELEATLARVIEVERRFGVYGRAAVAPEVRQEFEALMGRKVPPETLTNVPAFARLVETQEQKIAKLPPLERRRTLESLARREPRNTAWAVGLARESFAAEDYKAAIEWSSQALAVEPANGDALVIRGRARAMRKDYRAALTDLRAVPADRQTSVAADLFVCLVAEKDWTVARQVLEQLSESDRGRKDVAAATRRLPPVPVPTPTRVPEKVAERAPEPTPTTVPAATPAAPTPTATPAAPVVETPTPSPTPTDDPSEAIATARRLVSEGRAPDAEKILLAALRRGPATRELRKGLLEAACLAKDWRVASAQIPLVEPFGEGEEAWMFYASVSQFETGAVEAARSLLSRARPKIIPSPYVDYYMKKILGPSV